MSSVNNKASKQNSPYRSDVTVFKIEIALLLMIVCLLVLPVKLGLTTPLSDLSATKIVAMYYTATILVVALAEIILLWPLSEVRIISKPAAVVISIVFVLCGGAWLSGLRGDRLDFGGVPEGNVSGPLVIAILLPCLQLLFAIVGVGRNRS